MASHKKRPRQEIKIPQVRLHMNEELSRPVLDQYECDPEGDLFPRAQQPSYLYYSKYA